MSLKIGTSNIADVYAGSTKISAIYKGSALVYSSGIYENLLFSNLYHSLIPSTIDTYSITEKNKAKLNKIYANGVIENQLCDMLDTTKMTPYQMSVSVSNHILTGTVTGLVNPLINFNTFNSIENHKYICFLEIKKPYATKVYILGGNSLYLDQTPVANTWTFLSAFYTATSQINAFTIYPFIRDTSSGLQVGDSCDIRNLNVIDLTLMFGTGNEPTTLTDNRIQALLKRGYIEYNTGTYRSTDMGEIISESYNMLSLNRTQGVLNGSSYTKDNQQNFDENKYYAGLAVNDYVHQTAVSNVSISGDTISFTTNSFAYGLALPIKVIAGRAYTLEKNGTNAGVCYICWYNENGYFISSISAENNVSVIAPNNAYWGVIVLRGNADGATASYSNICFHLTATRTDYAPYNSFAKPKHFVPNKVNSVEDSFTMTDTGFIFVKRLCVTDLSSLTWTSTNYGYSSQISNAKPDNLNSVAENYTYSASFREVAGTWGWATNYIGVNTTSTPTGKFTYELATPQTITMPRKHLACVDLGTFNGWTKTGYGWYVSPAYFTKLPKATASNSTIGNIFCSKYISGSSNQVQNANGNGTIAVDNASYVLFRDSSTSNMTQEEVKNYLSGTYLFYETADVADEDNVIDFTGRTTLRFQGNGAINAHDTFEITSSEFVFTKNVGSYTFTGSETWNATSGSRYYCNAIQSLIKAPATSELANLLFTGSLTLSSRNGADSNDKVIFVFDNGYLGIKDTTNITSTATAQSYMADKSIYYELATPQVIRIPRKHLAVVDLGTLNWSYQSDNARFLTDDLTGILSTLVGTANMGKLYCSKYLTSTYDGSSSKNNIVYQYPTQASYNRVFIKDSRYTDVNTFKTAMKGVLLFYETNEAVADPVISTKFEIGGQLHSALFSWHKNQIIPNGDFSLSNSGVNTWYCQGTIYSIAFDSNTATVTKTASGGGYICYKTNSDITYPTGHKYLAVAMVKPSRACNLRFIVSDYQTGQAMTANVWNTLAYFANPSSLTNIYFGMGESDNSLQVNDTIQIRNVMLIDLTLGFGAGNEPTSIDDYRLAYLLKHGYIPTNTTGVYTHEDVEVLPNVEMRFGVTE